MGKRGQDEGSIYQRQDQCWAASISLGYEDGKRKRKTLYGETRKEVAQKLTAALRDRDKGLPIVSERLTVEGYLTPWLATARPTVEAITRERYELDVRRHILPTLGKVPLVKLTPAQVQRLLVDKLNAGMAPNSVRNIRAVLRRALNDALAHDLVSRNAAVPVHPPKASRREMKVYDTAQARRLLDAASSDRLEALFVLAVTTGMREGELLGLKWKHVNLDDKCLQVQTILKRLAKGLVLKNAKTNGSRRKIALTDLAVSALRRHWERQAEERAQIGDAWTNLDLVFCNSKGGYIFASNFLEDMHKPIVRRAGLPYIRFHDLRHTAATLMLLQGVHPKIVSEMLGHASVAITLSLYSYVLPDMQREAVGRIDALFGTQ